jgi:antitoxin ParD1/3/4
MAHIPIELSNDDLQYIDSEIAAGHSRSISELIAVALKDYRRARGFEELERLAEEGLNSGEPIEVTPEYWAKKEQQLLARARAAAK